MTTVTVSEDIKAKPSAVWAALSDFGGIKVGGPVTSFETKGTGGHAAPNSSRYRLAARLRAGDGAGGLRIAAAIWR